MSGGPRGPSAIRLMAGAFVLEVAVSAGVVAYAVSPGHQQHDPRHALQQFDSFYLDEPAPLADELGLARGRPALVIVCTACRAPDLGEIDVQVVVTGDQRIAEAYGLLTDGGRVGPGYAVIDSRQRVRYRTFDPGLAEHAEEIQILVEAAS